jgi:ankyrin repeat protein
MKRLLFIALGLLVTGAAVAAVLMIGAQRARRAQTELAKAAERGDAAAVRSLVARGEDVNARDEGFTPLAFAARAGDAETVNALLDAKADPNQRDCRNGWTPLIHAVHTHQRDAARALIMRGADVNARSGGCHDESAESGMTPLMFAAMYDDAELVKLLLERGADPRAEYDGDNALTHAVGGAALGKLADIDRAATQPCPTETVRLLLAKAPDLSVGGGALDSATNYIIRKKCPEVAALLDGRRPSPPPSPSQIGESR